MKQQAKRIIGINQRVPFAILDYGLAEILRKGSVDREDLKSYMLQFTKGENRAHKAAGYAKTILNRPQSVIAAVANCFSEADYARLPERERKALILAMLAITYPITYHLLVGMARVFNVQPIVSTQTIHEILGKIYGSNRTLAVAIDALLPMLIELGAIRRSKISQYEKGEIRLLKHPLLSEVWVYSDMVSSEIKALHQEELKDRLWNTYCKPELGNNTSLLKMGLHGNSGLISRTI